MKNTPVAQAKNQLSALLREVQGGASVTITDRGVPVARLVPVGPSKGIPAGAVALAQAGRLVLPERQPSARWLDLPRPNTAHRASAVAALLEERASGR